jgi:type I restriction enzyme S subunit
MKGLAKLPKGWQTVTMQQIATLDTRAVHPVAGSAYKFVGLEHVESGTGRILNVSEVDVRHLQSQKYRFDTAHVLYGKLRPYLNKVVLPDFSGICSTDILPVHPKRGVLREYIAFWLRSPSFIEYANTNATGTKMPRLGPKQFLKAPIPLPPILVQKRIVQVLMKADDIRGKRQQAVDLADAILSASFISMFGDPLENHKRFGIYSLKALADVRSGVTKGRKFKGQPTIELPYLRVANVQDGFLDLSQVKTIEALPKDLERFRLVDGDILMTEGGDPDKLGRGSIWRNQVEGCIHQNHVFRVRTERSKLAPEYLAALLRTQYAKHYFLSCAKRSSNLASVNHTQVRAFPVPVPPVALQRKFVSAVDQWDQTYERLASALRESVGMFNSLLHHSFTGELTAEWEAQQAQAIILEQTRRERQPRLVLLDFVCERQRLRPQEPVLVTSLMKYAFLLQKEGSTDETSYCFVPYKYGPFARELYNDLHALAADGLVTVTETDEEKTEITLLAAKQSEAEQAITELREELRADIAGIVAQYGPLDHSALLKLVYEKYPEFAKKSVLKRRQ